MSMKMITPQLLSTSRVTTLQSSFKNIVPNASSKLGDVILVSADRKYFLAHRIVLVSASDILATLLAINCDFCDESSDGNVVLYFDQISGSVLRNFLCLIYTGLSSCLKTEKEVSDLMSLCQQLRLKSIGSLAKPVPGMTYPISGPITSAFEEIDAPAVIAVTMTSKFMHSPKHTSIPQYDATGDYVEPSDYFNMSCNTVLKTEPLDISDGDYGHEDDDFNPMEIDFPESSDHLLNQSSKKVLRCANCSKEFQTKKRYENHITECISDLEFVETKTEPTDEPAHEELLNQPQKIKKTIDCGKKVEVYHCPNCPREFFTPKLYEKHTQECLQSSIDFEHMCEVCFRKFPTAQRLIMHSKIHSNESNFTCPQCDKEFRLNSTLKKHMLQCHKLEKMEIEEDKNLETSKPEMSYKVENERFVCLSGNCQTKVTSFEFQESLQEHFIEEHSVDKEGQKYCCDQCGKQFRFKRSLSKHVAKHNYESSTQSRKSKISRTHKNHIRAPKVDVPMRQENGRYYCLTGDCVAKGQSFQWINGIREHFMDKHATDDLKTFSCQFCGKMFGTNALRNKHEDLFHKQRFECTHCDRKFSSNTILTNHLRTHTGEKPFVCETCGNEFFNKGSLYTHIKNGHTKRYKCEECGEQFSMKGPYKEHMLQHPNSKESEENIMRRRHFKAPKIDMPMKEENGRFYCLTDDCVAKGQSFQYVNGLRDHFMEKHATEDQKCFPCNFCGKLFGTNALKNKHQHIFHELKFECTLCDRKYGQKSMLDNHMRTHTGEKPFVCETCGASFFMRGNLNKHIKETHMPRVLTRDQHCDQCGRAFFSISTLKKHIKTVHSEVRPFVCEECGKKYKAHDALKNHMETHSGISIPCEPCNLTFNSRSHYKRHMKRKHTKK